MLSTQRHLFSLNVQNLFKQSYQTKSNCKNDVLPKRVAFHKKSYLSKERSLMKLYVTNRFNLIAYHSF